MLIFEPLLKTKMGQNIDVVLLLKTIESIANFANNTIHAALFHKATFVRT